MKSDAARDVQGDRIRLRHVSSNRPGPMGLRMVNGIGPRHKHDRGRSWTDIVSVGMAVAVDAQGNADGDGTSVRNSEDDGRGRPVGARGNPHLRATGIVRIACARHGRAGGRRRNR